MAQFTRRSAWELQTQDPDNPWDPYTLAYAKAVTEMRSRAADDPTSWTFQAAMHGTYATPALATWNQCQHGTWYFLPWHRMYVWYFERIVRSVVVAQGGPADWALPFWNYSASTEYAALPPAFREQTYDPDGSGNQVPNPLYVPQRAAAYNQGQPLPDSATSLNCLNSPNFLGPPLPGFGGLVTGFSHDRRGFGTLEQVPHNIVHVLVGGTAVGECQGGWMSDPNCAAQDPIFWLHHSNIDRLWNVWNSMGHTNPTVAAWTDFDEFRFWDADGAEVKMVPGQVTSLDQLDYDYEPQQEAMVAAAAAGRRGPDDGGGGGGAAGGGAVRGGAAGADATPPAPRLLAANDESVALGTAPVETRVPLAGRATESLRAAADPADESVRHVYLHVEGLTADHIPGVGWEVHVTLPDGTSRAVGIVTFFGFRDQLDDAHGLGPTEHTFDITDLVGGAAEGDDVAVTFVPIGPEEEVSGSPRVGRVSISAH